MSTPPPDDYRRRQRTNLIGMAIVAVLIVASIALLVLLKHGVAQENCFAAGHRSCSPIDQ